MRRELFEAQAERWRKGDITPEDVIAAIGFWIGYPMFLELIGHDWRSNDVRTATYHALNFAHTQATHVLMEQAERYSLDPHPLYQCSRVVQEVYADAPEKYYAGRHDTWPECMGAARYSLPPGQQKALRNGEAVLIRLAVKLGLADKPNMASVAKAVTLPPPLESRCAPMSKTAIAQRLLNKPNARPRQVLEMMKRCDLREEGDGKWTIRLDAGLGAETIQRLRAEEWPSPPKLSRH
jgi:hypothetical protein